MGLITISRKTKARLDSLVDLPMIAVLDALAAEGSIPARRRADICSGVRSLCRGLNLPPDSTPVDPRLFAERLARATPVALGMSKGRFQNCRSHLDAAFAYADAHFARRRSRGKLAPAFVALLSNVQDRWQAIRLRRLFRFATELGIDPASIDEALFARFGESLGNSTLKNPRSLDRETRKAWNALVDTVASLNGQSVSVPTYVDHYVLPAAAFPVSLWSDTEAYLASRATKESAAVEDLLTEEELFGDDGETGRHVRIRASTANLVRYRVRQFASALVHRGIARPDDLVSLESLVAPKTVAEGLQFFISRVGGKRENSQIYGIVTDLLMIAEIWARSPAKDLGRLRIISSRVKPRQDGLPASARRSLAPFRDVGNVRAFLTVADCIVRDAEKGKIVDRKVANRVATALWIRIAQRAPLRISNLLGTHLDRNMVRSPGKDGTVALVYPPEQVKNQKAIEVPLSKATAALLDLYLKKYRPPSWTARTPGYSPRQVGRPSA